MEKKWLHAYPQGTPGEIDASAFRSLVDIFDDSCRRFGDRPAYHNMGTTLSFAELERLSRDFGAHLLAQGLTRGDRIALMMPNVLQYPIALFGALRAGLTVVNTNPQYTPRELRHQLRDSGARAIVVLENFAHVFAQVRADTQVTHVITAAMGDLARLPKRLAVNFVVRRVKHLVPPFELPGALTFRQALAQGARCDFQPPPVNADDSAFVQYTGGTTGVAKGAVLTHRNMVANLLQMAAFWRKLLEPGREVIITPLPLYHVFCLTCNCLLFMRLGGLNVLITNPRDIPGFVSELGRWRFSLITGVNTLYNALLAHPRFAHLDFSQLKLGVAGGMALHPSVAERWQRITGKPLVEGYGLTEASPVVACNPFDAPQVGTVGVPLPSTEISIREAHGQGEVPPGEPGELCVRGPQVMHSYWNRPDETRATYTPDGWLRTGDIAVATEEGFLRIVDRIKDLIIVSGFKVFPNEIEAVVGEHPAVLECGCIGVADARSGQAVKIFVVMREGQTVTAEELLEHCRKRLTAYKVPRYVEFRDSLPKTNVGKILRRELMQEESARAGRSAA
ncbi:MAG TPA: AMP-binding protein [Steroidobacteraceae bacterium]|nr:AMP-binding protein [Steroidobacteraceae bacterium]